MNHFFFDFETFGQSVIKAAIINCSFTVVSTSDFDDGITYDEILKDVVTLKLDVAAQVKAGYVVEKSSLDFWGKVSPEAKAQLKPLATDLTYSQFCDKLISYLETYKVDYWWSRSNTFDPILLWRIFEDEGRSDALNQRLKFWKVRDIRTWIDAKSDFALKNDFIPTDIEEWREKFKAHDSKHDIVADVLRFQKIHQLTKE